MFTVVTKLCFCKWNDSGCLSQNKGTMHYGLVIVGHSLGAGTAAILSFLLRPQYPTLHCYSYSPPGGLLRWVNLCVFIQKTLQESISHVVVSTLCRKLFNTCLPLSLTNPMFMFKFQIRLQSGVYCGHHCLLRNRVCICFSVHSIVKPKAQLYLYLFCVRVFQTCPHKLWRSLSFFFF